MNETPNDEPKSWLAAKWAGVAAVLAALILVIDFATKSIGLVALIVGEPEPVVVANVVDFENSSSCVQFAFSSLPESFVLEEIRLDIIASTGPDDIPGDMASSVFEKTVNFEVTLPYLVGQETEITLRAPIQASQPEDAFFLHWCPTLTLPGTRGSLTVVPSFFDATQEEIAPLNIRATSSSSIEEGLLVTLILPPNERVTVVDQFRDLLPQ